jgi:fatty acid-binding protein DegV
MAQGYAALAAGAVSLAGATASEVAAVAAQVAASSQVYFTVDTLDFLRRSGRISGTVAAIGSIMKVRPVMGMKDGETEVVDRERGTERARRRVRELAELYAAGLARPAAAVGLVGGDPLAHGLGIAINGPTIVSPPPTSLAIHAGPGMYNAAVANMPAEYFEVLQATARA